MSKTTDDAYERAEADTQVVTKEGTFHPLYSLSDIVYLACGDDTKGMITGIHIRPCGIGYSVTWADTRQETDHYGIELQDEPEL